MEITGKEDNTGDKAQDTDEAIIDNINNLLRETISGISERQDSFWSTKAQKMTRHKKKSIRKAKVRSAPQWERKSTKHLTQSKVSAGNHQ